LLKPTTLLITVVIFAFSFWLYSNLTTPDSKLSNKKRVTNLPWQITVLDPNTLKVIDLNVGKDTLGDADKVLKSEYTLAWFEKEDNSISVEAYFIKVSVSGIRAKVVLELDSSGLEVDYLMKNSGQPQIHESHSIQYPIEDLKQVLNNRTIKSLTFIPLINVPEDILKSYFGDADEIKQADQETQFWLYPAKGLLIIYSTKAKEVFQYAPVADFHRIQSTVMKTIERVNKEKKLQ